MRIRNQQQQPVKRKGKGITGLLLLLVVLFVGGAGGYIYMKGNPFAKETVDVKEKTSPEEAVSKFIGAAAKIGDNEPTLAAMFGDTTTQNKKTRLQACLDAKHYIEDRVYESICDEKIVLQSSKKTPYFYTSKPDNFRIKINSKEIVDVGGKKTTKVKATVSFDVIRKNYLINATKSTKDKSYLNIVEKKYKVENADIVLLNTASFGWKIVAMDDLNNKATDLLATWNNIGSLQENGEELSKQEAEYKSDDILKSIKAYEEPQPEQAKEDSTENKDENATSTDEDKEKQGDENGESKKEDTTH